MATNIIITNLLGSLPEDLPIGTEVATIAVEGVGVALTSATISSFEDVDFGGMTGSDDFPTDLFEIVGTKVILKSVLDYEQYGSGVESIRAIFTIDATLSDGSTVRANSSLPVTDVIEEIRGTGRADDIRGTDSKDYIITGSGNDQLRGFGGDDVLYGGTGADRLWGGDGADTFLFKAVGESTLKAADTIIDWQHVAGGGTRDLIDLSAIDARSDYSGDQPFKWLGSKDFDGKKGELRYDHEGGNTYVYADLNGDKHADLAIKLAGNIKMYADDFLL